MILALCRLYIYIHYVHIVTYIYIYTYLHIFTYTIIRRRECRAWSWQWKDYISTYTVRALFYIHLYVYIFAYSITRRRGCSIRAWQSSAQGRGQHWVLHWYFRKRALLFSKRALHLVKEPLISTKDLLRLWIHRAGGNIEFYTGISTKELYMSAKEPYISAKEHCISLQELHVKRSFFCMYFFQAGCRLCDCHNGSRINMHIYRLQKM